LGKNGGQPIGGDLVEGGDDLIGHGCVL
jgi:hypothetical protein